MAETDRRRTRKWLRLALVAMALLLFGCRGAVTPGRPDEPNHAAAQPMETPPASENAVVDETLPDSRQLVVWLPDFAGYHEEGRAAEVLHSAFRQFEQQHAGVRVDVQVKADSGASDTLSFLRAAQRVAPAILPDLVLMDSQQLWQLADLGLLQPIEAPSADRLAELYPFALDSVGYGGEWYGMPYAADVMHTAGYAAPAGQAPATWDQLLAGDQRFLFATAASDVYENGAVLLQYVGAGGQLLENGSTSSDEALRAVFDFLVEGREAGVIPDSVTELASLDGVWNALAAQGQGLGSISASRYLSGPDAPPGMVFITTPTRDGIPTALGTTWAFAVIGDDEEQRALAYDLIDDLLDPAVQGAWSQYVHRLPSQRASLQAWPNPSTYTDFLDRQMEAAVALPSGRAFADFATHLFEAQADVLRGELTPEDAVGAVRGPG